LLQRQGLLCGRYSWEKTEDERIAYFTADGQRITSIMHEPTYQRNWLPLDFVAPVGYAEAAKAAAALSVGIDFMRVDIMIANNRPYACEMSPFLVTVNMIPQPCTRTGSKTGISDLPGLSRSLNPA
jgi:hypothetical protein